MPSPCKEQVARAHHRYRNGGQSPGRVARISSSFACSFKRASCHRIQRSLQVPLEIRSGYWFDKPIVDLSRDSRDCENSAQQTLAWLSHLHLSICSRRFRILLPAHEDSHQDLSRSEWHCLDLPDLCAIHPCQNLREHVECKAG